jgi:LPS sulfotransferase NodH
MSSDDPRKDIVVLYDKARIAKALAQVENEEAGWRFYLRWTNIPYIELCYEDFVADYMNQSVALLKSLGIAVSINEIARSELKRQSQKQDPMIDMFRRDSEL